MDERLWKKRWMRAVRVAALLQYLPFVRMVGLNGSMVTGTFRPESDIDFLVVAEIGHLYTCRLFVTGFVTLCGLRHRPGHEVGTICLNRYITTGSLDIAEHSAYYARGFHNLIPLTDAGVYKDYIQANQWMADFGYPLQVHTPVREGRSVVQRIFEGVCWLAPGLEGWLARYQQRRILSSPHAQQVGVKIVATHREVRLNVPKEVHA